MKKLKQFELQNRSVGKIFLKDIFILKHSFGSINICKY